MSKKIPSLLTIVAFLAFLFFWTVRVIKLVSIIRTSLLPDFMGYYQGVVSLVSQKPDFALIISKSFGPPFVFIPFLPFALLPPIYAELATTFINLIGYFVTFFLIWKLYFKKTGPLFWAILALMSFSFPIVYSLGMGNPIGLVTLGIYSFWIFRKRLAKVFFLVISGLGKCGEAIKRFAESDKIQLLDVLFCDGGCINGPGIESRLNLAERRKKVVDFWQKSEA